MMAFASIYQLPMVGSDVCGYAQDTNEELCARWAMLGAFSPFYRNHNSNPPTISQEFYRWPSVTAAAKKAIDLRYKLLDYIYSAMYLQTHDGTPLINPMFYLYPSDPNTFGLDLQYFYGPGLLVSPVTEQGATSVDVYLPNDMYYDAWTYAPIRGKGATVTFSNLALTDIPVHMLGGVTFPMRVTSANTTTDLRTKDFDIVVAVGLHGQSVGHLYLDDGVSLNQAGTTYVEFHCLNGEFTMKGNYGYATTAKIASVTVLGQTANPAKVTVDGVVTPSTFDAAGSFVRVQVNKPISSDFSLSFS